MNYYNELKNVIIDEEMHARVKDYSKESYRVNAYYKVGKLLSEAGSHYGEGIIKEYSEKLTLEIGKKYSYRILFRMKQFYLTFNDEKVSTL